MITKLFNWPPPYQVRINPRVKYVQLQISAQGLAIILPHANKLEAGLKLLENKKNWVIRHFEKIKPEKTVAALTYPTEVHLPAMHECWKIFYEKTQGNLKLLERPHHELVVMGKITSFKQFQTLLKRWIKLKAKPFLTHELNNISLQTGLKFNRLQLREQKTIWGSCTSAHNISLNYQLVFLPYPLMRYILLHELCHTRFLNHSKSFWALVKKFDEAAHIHAKKSKRAEDFLPQWWNCKLG